MKQQRLITLAIKQARILSFLPFRNYENEKQFQAQSISIITGSRPRKNRHIPQLTQKYNSNRNLRNNNQNLRNNNRNLSSDCWCFIRIRKGQTYIYYKESNPARWFLPLNLNLLYLPGVPSPGIHLFLFQYITLFILLIDDLYFIGNRVKIIWIWSSYLCKHFTIKNQFLLVQVVY